MNQPTNMIGNNTMNTMSVNQNNNTNMIGENTMTSEKLQEKISVGNLNWSRKEHLELNEVLNRIKSGVYENQIKHIRDIVATYPAGDLGNPITNAKAHKKDNPDAVKFLESYNTAKTNLPAVIFQGQFPTVREKNTPDITPSGYIIADVDNLTKERLQSLKTDIQTDTTAVFFFESPSGYGLKIGYKAEGILNDTDNKRFFFALENYFKEIYKLQIDKSCKEICRLCFVSHDRDLWVNGNPELFNIDKWSPPEVIPKNTEKKESPAPVSVNHTDLSDSDLWDKMFSNAKNGNAIRDLYNGNIAGHASQSEADMALCGHLAFYTGRDAVKMDSMFKQSSLYREKWDKIHDPAGRRTYGQMTIDKAIANCTKTYNPDYNRTQTGENAKGHNPKEPEKHFNFTDMGNGERLIDRHGNKIRYSFESGKWLYWTGKKWEYSNKGEINQYAKDTIRHIPKWNIKKLEKERGDLTTESLKLQTDLYELKKDADETTQGQIAELEEQIKSISIRHKEINEEILLEEAKIKFSKKSEENARVNAMIALAKHEVGITVGLEEFDRDKWFFNCDNGTIDLRTGTLKTHNRLDLNSKISPVKYDVNAKCPLWDKFLCEVFNNDRELIEFMQRSVGYALTGDIREEVFWVMHGKGSNGKGTFLKTIMSILSDYGKTADFSACFTPVDKQNDNVLNHLATLKGSRFVSASESEDGKKLKENVIKNVTAPDTEITARFKFQDPFTYMPEFKIFLATNYKPVIKGTDEGIWRRVMLIPFNQTFTGKRKDDSLKTKLQAELSGVLKWAVDGCLKWQKEGLNPPAVVIKATQQYREEMDWLSDFISECCEVNPIEKIEVSKLYDSYLAWQSGERPNEKAEGKRAFNKRLEDKGFVKKPGHSNAYTWFGITLIALKEVKKPEVESKEPEKKEPKEPPKETPEPEVKSGYQFEIPEKCLSCAKRDDFRCKKYDCFCEGGYSTYCNGKGYQRLAN